MAGRKHPAARTLLGFVLLAVVICLCYSNTFEASWQLDDYPNIVNNTNLHLEHLTLKSLYQTFFDARGKDPQMEGRLYRPVANLSFALNWYWGKNNPAAYHAVNLGLHVLTAFVLYLTILKLLASPLVISQGIQNKATIALLATLLWALNPIQTQAVTYIVQRMAVMAAFFYLLGMYCYVAGRNRDGRYGRTFWFVGCLLSFLAAMGCKENAVMLPLALLLVEYLFYLDDRVLQKYGRFFLKVFLTIGGVFVLAIVLMIVFRGNPLDYVQSRYADRPFSLWERLITQPRILLMYLCQIFYPIPQRLSLMHHVLVSKSLLQPWTTLPAILGVCGLILTGFLKARSRPLLAFALLFYFLNHAVESTILPLELVFEHRNYLPSLFLFLPIAAGCLSFLSKRHQRSRFLFASAVLSITVVVGLFGIGTYVRNMAWRSEQTLWQDVMDKAPELARPHQKLAAWYDQQGKASIAIGLYQRALQLEDPRPAQSKTLSLNNLGDIYYRQRRFGQAIGAFEGVLALNPDNQRARYNLSLALIGDGQFAKALQQAEILFASRAESVRILNLIGFLYLRLGQPEKALEYLQRAQRLAPDSRNTLLNLGSALSDLGDYAAAGRNLRKADQLYPGDAVIKLRLIENALLGRDRDQAGQYAQHLLRIKSAAEIENLLAMFNKDNRLVPLRDDLLRPFFAAELPHPEKSGIDS